MFRLKGHILSQSTSSEPSERTRSVETYHSAGDCDHSAQYSRGSGGWGQFWCDWKHRIGNIRIGQVTNAIHRFTFIIERH